MEASISAFYDSHLYHFLLTHESLPSSRQRNTDSRLLVEELEHYVKETCGLGYMLVGATLLGILGSFSQDQGDLIGQDWVMVSLPLTLLGRVKRLWLLSASEGKGKCLELFSHQNYMWCGRGSSPKGHKLLLRRG